MKYPDLLPSREEFMNWVRIEDKMTASANCILAQYSRIDFKDVPTLFIDYINSSPLIFFS